MALCVGKFLYGVYAWIVLILSVLAAVLSALLVPFLAWRRRCVSFFSRLPLRLAGVSTDVRGIENIPRGDCVVVANHASYLDGLILQGYLPARFSFVIKGEMQNFPVVGFMLRRIGSRFVERFEASGSARDARRLLRAASDGESLVVFPEGTFIRNPGLGRFRSGAFAAAINAGVPVVPVGAEGRGGWFLGQGGGCHQGEQAKPQDSHVMSLHQAVRDGEHMRVGPGFDNL